MTSVSASVEANREVIIWVVQFSPKKLSSSELCICFTESVQILFYDICHVLCSPTVLLLDKTSFQRLMIWHHFRFGLCGCQFVLGKWTKWKMKFFESIQNSIWGDWLPTCLEIDTTHKQEWTRPTSNGES